MAASGTYWGYASWSHSRLGDLVVHPGARESPTDLFPTQAALSQQLQESPALGLEKRAPYPGGQLLPRYWADPLRASPPNPTLQRLLAEFLPVDSNTWTPGVTLPRATQLLIPSIGVDSSIKELEIVDLGDSRAYETPDNVVGHIPVTANSGERGNGWFFGHLESPLRGEGNVFGRLPEIPNLLRQGEEVFVVLRTARAEYLYRATHTDVVHESQIHLYDTEGPVITLVSCVPRWVYDYRLLVTAELVGTRPS